MGHGNIKVMGMGFINPLLIISSKKIVRAKIASELAEDRSTKNADMIGRAEDIINSPKNRRMVNGKFLISRLKTSQHILDSLVIR